MGTEKGEGLNVIDFIVRVSSAHVCKLFLKKKQEIRLFVNVFVDKSAKDRIIQYG